MTATHRLCYHSRVSQSNTGDGTRMGWNEKRHNIALLMLLVLAVIPLTAFTHSARTKLKSIAINDGGRITHCYTGAENVSQLLAEQNIVLDYNDVTRPSLVTTLTSGMCVEVRRIEVSEFRGRVPYDVPARTTRSSAVPRGKEIVVDEGRAGVKEVVRYVANVNGAQVAEHTLQSRVISTPVRRSVMVGTGQPAGHIPGSVATPEGGRVLIMEATAYAPDTHSCGKADGITAIGLRATYGIVAVDRRVIPMGTRLFVEGYGYALAGDVGGAIRGNRIDLCFNTHREAVRYGRRTVKVHILD